MSWDECSDAVERFKDDIIFADMVETEAESKSMIDWLKFLHMHTFTPRHFENEVSRREDQEMYRVTSQVNNSFF